MEPAYPFVIELYGVPLLATDGDRSGESLKYTTAVGSVEDPQRQESHRRITQKAAERIRICVLR